MFHLFVDFGSDWSIYFQKISTPSYTNTYASHLHARFKSTPSIAAEKDEYRVRPSFFFFFDFSLKKWFLWNLQIMWQLFDLLKNFLKKFLLVAKQNQAKLVPIQKSGSGVTFLKRTSIFLFYMGKPAVKYPLPS